MNSLARARRGQAWIGDASGSAAVEFALVLPVLLLLSLGALELGRLFWSYHIATAAVRDAARYAARVNFSCATGMDPATRQQVINLTRTGTFNGQGHPLISGWTSDSSVSVTVTCIDNTNAATGVLAGPYQGLTEIPVIQVAATVPYTLNFAGLFGGGVTSFNVSHQEAWTE